MSAEPAVAFSALEPAEQARLLHELAERAAAYWPLEVQRIEPIKIRENAVYAVYTAEGPHAVLRVHRLGYHSDAALESEAQWMQALAHSGIEVPQPIPSRAGRPFERVEHARVPGPRQVDMLGWIEGRQLGEVGAELAREPAWIERVYGTIGELMAAMHNQANAWQPPPRFQRHRWDVEGLAGERPLWGRFWELEALSASQCDLFRRMRLHIAEALARYGDAPDRFGLIHADLVPENILVLGDRPRVIDFDDAGYGWHLFDLATTLYFIRRERHYAVARDALIAGYRRRRALAAEHLRLLPLFLAARGTTYLGWVHTRKGEQVARELTPQLIELAVAACEDCLAQ